MLELNDPLWRKLDDAFESRDIPEALARLSNSWDGEEANALFWESLYQQGTVYGATYAAVPYLLKIAEPEANRPQRLEIAGFWLRWFFARSAANMNRFTSVTRRRFWACH